MFCTGTIQRVSNASPSEIMRQRLAVMGSLCDIGRGDANPARRSGLLVRAVLFFRWRALYADDLRLALVTWRRLAEVRFSPSRPRRGRYPKSLRRRYHPARAETGARMIPS